MSLKSKNFTLKKIIAIAIIGATIFSAIISTIYLLLSNKNIQKKRYFNCYVKNYLTNVIKRVSKQF